MNKQETRHLISHVFGTCDPTQIKYSTLYQLFHEKLAREYDGVCCVNGCTSPITNISYKGELDLYQLKKSGNWFPYCRAHRKHPIPEIFTNVVSSQSSSAPVSSSACKSSNKKPSVVEPEFYFNFTEKNNK